MKRLSLCSLRGGAGASSLAAMLACALHALGQSVLLVDLNESDLLRLHFGVDYEDPHGWAAALSQGAAWHEQAFQLEEGLMLLPYGRFGTPLGYSHKAQPDDAFWIQATAQLTGFSWVIFDTPTGLRSHAALRDACDGNLVIAQPDMASHVLLMQTPLPAQSHLLVNRLDPSQELATDIVQDWRQRYGTCLMSLQVNHDENIHEALACGVPVQRRTPGASGARDAGTLATWCMARIS